MAEGTVQNAKRNQPLELKELHHELTHALVAQLPEILSVLELVVIRPRLPYLFPWLEPTHRLNARTVLLLRAFKGLGSRKGI